MAIRTIQVATCDNPACTIREHKIDVDTDVFVDAGTYDVAFHADCWDSMTGPVLAQVLGLDDIKWMVRGERDSKVIYTKERPT